MKNLGFITALLLAVSFNANAYMIVDDFNGAFGGVRSVDSTAAAEVLSQGEGLGGEIVGDSRDLLILKTSTIGDPNPPNPVLGADLAIIPTGPLNGFMSYSNDALTTSFALLQWDGVDNNIALQMGLGNLNLLANNQTKFEVDVISSDLGFLFEMIVYSSFNQWTSVALLADPVSSPTTVSFGFDLFSAAKCISEPGTTCGVGGAADFSNVNAMTLEFLSFEPNIDLAIDEIRVVPAPATIALLGLGLLSFGFASRRRVRSTLQA